MLWHMRNASLTTDIGNEGFFCSIVFLAGSDGGNIKKKRKKL